MKLAASSTFTEAEWNTRVELALCYRLVAHFGLDDQIYTHISARVPGESGHFLLNCLGLRFEEVTASSLVKLDLEGRPVGTQGHWWRPVRRFGTKAEFRTPAVTAGAAATGAGA